MHQQDKMAETVILIIILLYADLAAAAEIKQLKVAKVVRIPVMVAEEVVSVVSMVAAEAEQPAGYSVVQTVEQLIPTGPMVSMVQVVGAQDITKTSNLVVEEGAGLDYFTAPTAAHLAEQWAH
jgi:hypothetical protein